MKFSVLSALSLVSSVVAFAPTSTNIRTTALEASRKPFISGNWKLNPQTKDEAVKLAGDISSAIGDDTPESDIALFVPYVFIEATMGAADGKLIIGAEAISTESDGAFTGAIASEMVKSIGVQWSLAGHSERRSIFGDTDENVNKQVLKLLENDMSCMLCIGESLEEYEHDLAGARCALQLKKGLAGVSKEEMSRIAVAYEPVWAIGTGKVATPQIAQDVHKICRDIIADIYDQETADSIRIVYGGSVSPDSVDGLMAQEDIDGALVGGASLDAEKFGRIINFQTV